MGALTAEMPKPMLPLAGRPLLEHVLDRLRGGGIRRVLVVTGFQAGLIEGHFSSYPLPIEWRRQKSLSGTASAALLAREFVAGDNFLLSYGDILADPADYQGMANLLENDAAIEAVVGVKYVEDPWQGAAVYEEEGRLRRIVEKPTPGSSATHWNSAGIYAFRSSVFNYLERVPRSSRGEFELTTALELLIDAGACAMIHALEGDWLDVGRPEDLEAARRLVSQV